MTTNIYLYIDGEISAHEHYPLTMKYRETGILAYHKPANRFEVSNRDNIFTPIASRAYHVKYSENALADFKTKLLLMGVM